MPAWDGHKPAASSVTQVDRRLSSGLLTKHGHWNLKAIILTGDCCDTKHGDWQLLASF